MEQEIWKDIPLLEGYYQISNLGRVKSLSKLFKVSDTTICDIRKRRIWKHI